MMLFSEVRGLPVVLPGRGGPIGRVTSLTVDVAAARVSHVRLRAGRFRRERVLPRDAVDTFGPGAVRAHSPAPPGQAPPRRDLLGHRILTDTGNEQGTVLDVAFDPATGRLLALFTSHGEVPPTRLLGLGDHALVVRAA
ncbi:PRC-barrel domain-containing protein [Streptomyces sp. NPDC057245]|uniref:PRC-barrel domain-containing protein n=1 Tax=Streptomyces TaxID=1883 RepID=UPI001C1E2353|nr:PRC-barrel domain-containing protein [Streptomyces sp. A108]MBU6534793.1 PRC-barrel domain-containing protein [Streptomyces sp. A108]